MQIGDRVRCIRGNGGFLLVDEIYTITDISGIYICVDDCGMQFYADRFVLDSECRSPFNEWEKQYAL